MFFIPRKPIIGRCPLFFFSLRSEKGRKEEQPTEEIQASEPEVKTPKKITTSVPTAKVEKPEKPAPKPSPAPKPVSASEPTPAPQPTPAPEPTPVVSESAPVPKPVKAPTAVEKPPKALPPHCHIGKVYRHWNHERREYTFFTDLWAAKYLDNHYDVVYGWFTRDGQFVRPLNSEEILANFSL